jgi:hypothetical protein
LSPADLRGVPGDDGDYDSFEAVYDALLDRGAHDFGRRTMNLLMVARQIPGVRNARLLVLYDTGSAELSLKASTRLNGETVDSSAGPQGGMRNWVVGFAAPGIPREAADVRLDCVSGSVATLQFIDTLTGYTKGASGCVWAVQPSGTPGAQGSILLSMQCVLRDDALPKTSKAQLEHERRVDAALRGLLREWVAHWSMAEPDGLMNQLTGKVRPAPVLQ